jgi:flagellar hook-basal body complex protein FliE
MIDRIVPPAALSVGSSPAIGAADLARSAASAALPEAPTADFGAMLGQLASNASSVLKTAEAVSMAGIRGQASVQQVVEAVMSAEQTLHGAIAIRDKVVSAYLELSRMSI